MVNLFYSIGFHCLLSSVDTELLYMLNHIWSPNCLLGKVKIVRRS
jgi:hypothetical protein